MFIALSQRLIKHQDYDELRQVLSLEWGEFFDKELKEFLPLPLSFTLPFYRYKKVIKGCILSGGNDLSIFDNSDENIIRDTYEKEIIKHCIEDKIPILAICKGAQLLAHFFHSSIKKCENHIGKHLVRDKNGCEFEVNSFHHYAITKLGKDLECLAKAKDESIEAFKHKNLPFYATMWHIERKGGLIDRSILQEFKQEILRTQK